MFLGQANYCFIVCILATNRLCVETVCHVLCKRNVIVKRSCLCCSFCVFALIVF